MGSVTKKPSPVVIIKKKDEFFLIRMMLYRQFLMI